MTPTETIPELWTTSMRPLPGYIKASSAALDRYKQLIDIYQEDTMRAAVITNYRQPLETRDRPDPTPGPVDATIQTHPQKSVMATNPVPISERCLTITRTPTKATVHCTGRITSDTARSLRATVQPLFPHSNTVVLDLTNVSYMDSSGLGTIVALCASAKAANCQLKLLNLNRRLKESLSLARLNEVLVDSAFWRTW